MNIVEYQEAIDNLDLPKEFSLKMLKKAYKFKIKECHPDTAVTNNGDEIKDIQKSYLILLEYIENYTFSFAKENIQMSPKAYMEKKMENNWGLW